MLFDSKGQGTIKYCTLIGNILIRHSLATITLIQEFRNLSDTSVELEYTLELDRNSVLMSLQALYSDGSIIECQIIEKESAQERYQDAVSASETPVLMTQSSDSLNLFIGALPANDQIKIKLIYSCPMSAQEDYWRLILCKVLIQTPNLIEKFTLIVESDSPITDWKSNWDFQFTLENQNLKGDFSISENIEKLDELEFIYKCEESVRPKGILQKNGDVYAAMLSFIPFYDCVEDAERYEETGEFIFFLDRSGSMCGNRIQLAKKAVIMFIKSLGVKSRFNIVSFGSSFEFLFPESRLVDSVSVDEAIKKLNSFGADMGGTNIFNPLDSIFNIPVIEDYPRYLYLLTDGEVDSLDEVLELISAHKSQCKVYTLGIGEANENLIKKAAKNGNGESYIIKSIRDISKCVINALEKCISPYITNVHISWNYQVVPSLTSLKNFQYGRSFCIYAILDKYPEVNPVLTCFESFNKRTLTLTVDNFKLVDGEEIFKLWAKHKISEEGEDVLNASLNYQVISPLTAYFGCRKDIDGSIKLLNTFTKINKSFSSGNVQFKSNLESRSLLNSTEKDLEYTVQKFKEEISKKKQKINEMNCELSGFDDKIEKLFKNYYEYIERLKTSINSSFDKVYDRSVNPYSYLSEYEYMRKKRMVFKEKYRELIDNELIKKEKRRVKEEKIVLQKLNENIRIQSIEKMKIYKNLITNSTQEIGKIKKSKNNELFCLTDIYELIADVIKELIEFIKIYFGNKLSIMDANISLKYDEIDFLRDKKLKNNEDEDEQEKKVIECEENINIEDEKEMINEMDQMEQIFSEKQEQQIQYIEDSIFIDFHQYYDEIKYEILNKMKHNDCIEQQKYELDDLKYQRDYTINEMKSKIESLIKEAVKETKDLSVRSVNNARDLYESEIDIEDDGFMKIVLGQKPEGFWEWSEITKLINAEEIILKLANATDDPKVLGTALALTLLNKEYRELKEEWILIEKKAIKWMKKQISNYSIIFQKFKDI